MISPFDEIIERKGTNSLKYDFAAERGKPADALPLWVADMDFRTSPAIIKALTQHAQYGIFGYSESGEAYFRALRNWYSSYFNWELRRDWLVKTPGVVFAICAAIRSLTKEGDAILIQRPVYYPFSESILANRRKLINNPLIYSSGQYSIDFEDFENKIIENNVKLFLLCSPHNPVGRVWTKDELIRLGDICVQHSVIVVSDEIHSDFAYPGFKHHVFASLKPEYFERTITCTAPTKTFNLAGLQISNIIIGDSDLRKKFKEELDRAGYSQSNAIGLVACQVAYESGRPWLEKLKQYLNGNRIFLQEFLKDNIPQIKLIEPQGTYLAWLDCRCLNMESHQLDDFMTHKAKLWLDSGSLFGSEGQYFERINFACPRDFLEKALRKLKAAVDSCSDSHSSLCH